MESVPKSGVVFAALIALLAAACAGAPTGPDSGGGTAPQHATTHFVFHYTPGDAASVAAIGNAVEAEHSRVTTELQVTGMRPVHVYYYATRDALRAAVRPIVGELPVWASGLVTGPDRIHLISPAAQGQPVERAAASVVHEFAHCATLWLQPAAGNNPRWLWETVAVYEARQFVEPARLPYLVALDPPSLAELNSFDNTRVYDVGFLLGEFIVSRGGGGALPALVRALGDTRAVLGLSEADFEREWFAFVRARYLGGSQGGP